SSTLRVQSLEVNVLLHAYGLEMLPGVLFDVLVETVAVRVHRDNRWKLVHRQMPHGLRSPEFEKRHTLDAGDRTRVELRRATNSVQVYRSVLFQCRKRLRTHAAFADDRSHAVALDDLPLIRLLSNARCRTGSRYPPPVRFVQAFAFFHHDRAAVIQDGAAQIDRWLVLHQMGMYGIASGEHRSREEHD